jgi:hypothetical protein
MSFWVERNRGGSFWARVDGPYPKIDLARARLDEMRRVDGNMFDYRIAQNFAKTVVPVEPPRRPTSWERILTDDEAL